MEGETTEHVSVVHLAAGFHRLRRHRRSVVDERIRSEETVVGFPANANAAAAIDGEREGLRSQASVDPSVSEQAGEGRANAASVQREPGSADVNQDVSVFSLLRHSRASRRGILRRRSRGNGDRAFSLAGSNSGLQSSVVTGIASVVSFLASTIVGHVSPSS
jgi:hypothetical protein